MPGDLLQHFTKTRVLNKPLNMQLIGDAPAGEPRRSGAPRRDRDSAGAGAGDRRPFGGGGADRRSSGPGRERSAGPRDGAPRGPRRDGAQSAPRRRPSND